jgi:hypothetical protein
MNMNHYKWWVDILNIKILHLVLILIKIVALLFKINNHHIIIIIMIIMIINRTKIIIINKLFRVMQIM